MQADEELVKRRKTDGTVKDVAVKEKNVKAAAMPKKAKVAAKEGAESEAAAKAAAEMTEAGREADVAGGAAAKNATAGGAAAKNAAASTAPRSILKSPRCVSWADQASVPSTTAGHESSDDEFSLPNFGLFRS